MKYFSLSMASLALADTQTEYDVNTKSVTYSSNDGGGDQKFTDEQFKALFEKKKPSRGRGNERGLDKSITKWPWSVADDGYVINYYVDESTYPSERLPTLYTNVDWVRNELAKLNVIIKDCKTLNGCKQAKQSNSAHYVRMINDACYSYMGQVGWMDVGQTMGIGWCYNERGSILHEFTHALGFIHEHQRFDRGTKLDIPTVREGASGAEIQALGLNYATYNDWKANCAVYNEDAIETSGTEYDTGSIMQYPKGGCGIDFKGTSANLAQRLGYSETDKFEVAKNYPYLGDGEGGTHVEPEEQEVIVPGDCLRGIGSDYRGDHDFATRSGTNYKCAKWSSALTSTTNAMANYVKGKVADLHLKDHNYCRNYDNDPRGPWCMTDERTDGWSYCSVPTECNTAPVTVPAPVVTAPPTKAPGPIAPTVDTTTCLVDDNDDGSNYKGDISVTADGQKCSSWADYKESDYPYKIGQYFNSLPAIRDLRSALNKDHCRNIDGDSKAWCLVAGSELGYGYCDIPKCVSPNACDDCEEVDPSQTMIEGNGRTYRGTHSVDVDGFACTNWDNWENDLRLNGNNYNYIKSGSQRWWTEANGIPRHNHCRNYDSDSRTWCLTSNPGREWAYCDIAKVPGSAGEYQSVSRSVRKKGGRRG